MLSQLQDAGNTVTLAHYLQLLQGAGMVAGLSQFSHSQVRRRAASLKLQVLNTALMTAQSGRTGPKTRGDLRTARFYKIPTNLVVDPNEALTML